MNMVFRALAVLCALVLLCGSGRSEISTVARAMIEDAAMHLKPVTNKTNATTTLYAISLNFGGNDSSLHSLQDLEYELELENQRKGKECSKNLTDCMINDPEYGKTLKQLTKYLFSTSAPFDLSLLDGVSGECKRASQNFIYALQSYHLWALKMYDASAKIPSGLLSGNINQLGDYDLCMSSTHPEEDVHSRYCLAYLQVETPHSPYLSAIHDRLYAHQSFKSKLGDPGHRVPRFSSINWGLCVPDQCSAKDVEIGFRNAVHKVLGGTDLDYRAEVDSHMCYTSRPAKRINYDLIFGSSIFLIILLFVAYATVYDMQSQDVQGRNEWIMAFSLRKNVRSMVSIEKQANDLEAVHGIRFLNALMLIFSHKSMALLFLPYVNRTQMSEIIGQPWTVIGRAASLYTDPFIMLSGTLTAYSLFGRLQRNIKINILDEYISRIFRMIPSLAALILFCTFVLPHIASGPMWNLVVTHHSDICKQYAWRNLIFIHNYFGFKDMCLTHTHHVGIDTQLFFASPFLIMLLWKWPKRGAFTLVSLAVISTCMRYYVTYYRKLSNYIHFGTSIEQLFATADYMYILPAHRLTVYIIGIFLGYLLRQSRSIVLNSVQIHLGNVLAVIAFVVSLVGPAFMGSINYVYNPIHAAWYAAFVPILWCYAFAWVIFTSHLGYKSTIGTIFSFPYFKVWTKISYTVYLTQFPIFFFNVGTLRHSEYYSFIPKNLNVLELVCIFGLSILLTLVIETPFQNIKGIIFKKAPRALQSPEMVKKKIS